MFQTIFIELVYFVIKKKICRRAVLHLRRSVNVAQMKEITDSMSTTFRDWKLIFATQKSFKQLSTELQLLSNGKKNLDKEEEFFFYIAANVLIKWIYGSTYSRMQQWRFIWK